jgi:hypothetical protein
MTKQEITVFSNYRSILEIKKDIEEWLRAGYIVRAFLERQSEVLVVFERSNER